MEDWSPLIADINSTTICLRGPFVLYAVYNSLQLWGFTIISYKLQTWKRCATRSQATSGLHRPILWHYTKAELNDTDDIFVRISPVWREHTECRQFSYMPQQGYNSVSLYLYAQISLSMNILRVSVKLQLFTPSINVNHKQAAMTDLYTPWLYIVHEQERCTYVLHV